MTYSFPMLSNYDWAMLDAYSHGILEDFLLKHFRSQQSLGRDKTYLMKNQHNRKSHKVTPKMIPRDLDGGHEGSNKLKDNLNVFFKFHYGNSNSHKCIYATVNSIHFS